MLYDDNLLGAKELLRDDDTAECLGSATAGISVIIGL